MNDLTKDLQALNAISVIFMAAMFISLMAGCVQDEQTIIPDADRRHLVLMAGQSNMAGVNADHVYAAIAPQLPGDEVIVVKYAVGSTSIARWAPGALYDVLLSKALAAVGPREIDTVTLIWVQGESDAWLMPYRYEGQLLALLENVRTDIGTNELHFVLGRLSDHKVGYPGWDHIRAVQEAVADADPLGCWVNTDDINYDGLHYGADGYAAFAVRLGNATIRGIL